MPVTGDWPRSEPTFPAGRNSTPVAALVMAPKIGSVPVHARGSTGPSVSNTVGAGPSCSESSRAVPSGRSSTRQSSPGPYSPPAITYAGVTLFGGIGSQPSSTVIDSYAASTVDSILVGDVIAETDPRHEVAHPLP